MLLSDGYHDLPAGRLATVVTYLEMRSPAPARTERVGAPWVLRHVEAPGLEWYRALYRHVGEAWLWSSRLVMPDDELRALLADPDVELHALEIDGRAEGILELDFRVRGQCEIGFFGVAAAQTGKGVGRWLMNRAIALAWRRPISRLWLHTCDMDSPAALPFYLASGFTPFDRKVEVFEDPRLLGVLPRHAAPQVLLVDPR